MRKLKILLTVIIVLLVVSLYFNLKPGGNQNGQLWFINVPGANTRATYDSYHNIREAQAYSKGKGVKVGIIDKYFGFSANRKLYSGGKDFIGNKPDFEEIGEHGLWMAETLKEIAPEAEIYALNARNSDRRKEKTGIIAAIDWAIENKIDILTYSADPFLQEDRTEIDKAVLKAIQFNITVIFLHYDLEENILPYGFFPKKSEAYSRGSDVNVYHYDYNLLLLKNYKNYLAAGRQNADRGDMPYFSFSSMPTVLAGIAALMKEKDKDLTNSQIKNILIETSKTITYNNYEVGHVVDAVASINATMKMAVQSK